MQTIVYLAGRLKRAQRENVESMKSVPESAGSLNGSTLFDVVLESVPDNKNVKLKLE